MLVHRITEDQIIAHDIDVRTGNRATEILMNLGYHPVGSAMTFGRQAAETVAKELGK